MIQDASSCYKIQIVYLQLVVIVTMSSLKQALTKVSAKFLLS